MNFRPKENQLITFGPRVRPGLNLLHDDGGIYRILSDDGIVRTKHVTFMKTQFPGISVRGNNRNTPLANIDNDGTLVIPLPVESPPRTDQQPTPGTTHHDTPQPAGTESLTSRPI